MAVSMPEDVKSVIPMGCAVGIGVDTQGVTIVGLCEVDGASPAKDAGLQSGDIICSIDGTPVRAVKDIQPLLDAKNGAAVEMTLHRGDQELTVCVQPAANEDGKLRLGIWVRDSVLGIGTLTFVEPSTGIYGALGHGIAGQDEPELLEIRGGQLLHAAVDDVRMGEPGKPGELHGSFDREAPIGTVEENTQSGIYGVLESIPGGKQKTMPIADASQIRLGEAEIWSNVSGEDVERYQVKILSLQHDGPDHNRNLLLKITDERLLAQTGGIVQGMSGSPIIQDGRIVGAVTHVCVNL